MVRNRHRDCLLRKLKYYPEWEWATELREKSPKATRTLIRHLSSSHHSQASKAGAFLERALSLSRNPCEECLPVCLCKLASSQIYLDALVSKVLEPELPCLISSALEWDHHGEPGRSIQGLDPTLQSWAWRCPCVVFYNRILCAEKSLFRGRVRWKVEAHLFLFLH